MEQDKRRYKNMRYAQIRNIDISNGEGVGVALFVQGCNLRCKNCLTLKYGILMAGKNGRRKQKNKDK